MSTSSYPKELLTAREVADHLAIALRTVWRKAACGELPAPLRLGPRLVRSRAADIHEYLERLSERR